VPEEADAEVSVTSTLALAMKGRVLAASDRRVLEAFAAQAAIVLDREPSTGTPEGAPSPAAVQWSGTLIAGCPVILKSDVKHEAAVAGGVNFSIDCDGLRTPSFAGTIAIVGDRIRSKRSMNDRAHGSPMDRIAGPGVVEAARGGRSRSSQVTVSISYAARAPGAASAATF
jgi:hypothetical protein